MSEVEGSVRRIPHERDDGTAAPQDAGDEIREIGLGDLVTWLSKRGVSVAAVAMIIAQLIWKAGFLGQFYFRQDDLHFTEIALRSSLGWKYLSYVGSGHLHPGVL